MDILRKSNPLTGSPRGLDLSGGLPGVVGYPMIFHNKETSWWIGVYSFFLYNFMVLSDQGIRKFLEQGDIKITPLNEAMIKEGSYTFTLNTKLFLPKHYDVIDVQQTDVVYNEVEMDPSGYILQPGDFLLGQTKEMVSISQSLCCMLDARTSLARIGLNVLQGSTFIQPGQEESYETLEISNISKSPIRIYSGMKIVKGIFLLLSSASSQKYAETGRYGRQTTANPLL